MSKRFPVIPRNPPRYVDLSEAEVAHLLLVKSGVKMRRPIALIKGAGGHTNWRETLNQYGIVFTRDAVLLRSFRNV